MSKPKSGVFTNTIGSKYKETQENETKNTTSTPKFDSNKKHHIFHQEKHNLQNYLKSFNNDEDAAFNKLNEEYNNYIKRNGITSGFLKIKVQINGFEITIRGVVIDGIGHIGTAYEGDE